MSESFERLDSRTVWEGKIARVRVDRFRYADGEEVEREVVGHPGAVGVVAYDDARVWLVRQPREAVEDPALLEVPAGKLDVEGESPLQTAQRELSEEVGLEAGEWRELLSFFTSPGFTDERVVLFAATGLRQVDAHPDEGERIEVVEWPLDRLDEVVAACHDSKSLIALMWLRHQLA
ncbi:MAG: NUDIX hydrolase [Actinomycetota bacterium]|nr:NUDIX hydrolase [Actinomycetota bacterium]